MDKSREELEKEYAEATAKLEQYFKPDVLRKEFDLPANLEPVNILVVGYSDEGTGDPNRFNKQRIPMSQLVSYETL